MFIEIYCLSVTFHKKLTYFKKAYIECFKIFSLKKQFITYVIIFSFM